MLVLTRKDRQSILLTGPDGETRVTLIWALDGKAKIGITAPPEVKVLRAELENRDGKGVLGTEVR